MNGKQRIYKVIDEPIKVNNNPKLADLNVSKGDIQFSNVSFKYENSNDKAINEINLKLQNEQVDITLPERSFNRGKIHPVSQVIDEISSIFSEVGFSVQEGPDVENEYNLSLIHI